MQNARPCHGRIWSARTGNPPPLSRAPQAPSAGDVIAQALHSGCPSLGIQASLISPPDNGTWPFETIGSSRRVIEWRALQNFELLAPAIKSSGRHRVTVRDTEPLGIAPEPSRDTGRVDTRECDVYESPMM